MKAQRIKEEPQFKPIKVELTFETPEEYIAFKSMLYADVSVPEIIFKGECDYYYNLQKVMGVIRESI